MRHPAGKSGMDWYGFHARFAFDFRAHAGLSHRRSCSARMAVWVVIQCVFALKLEGESIEHIGYKCKEYYHNCIIWLSRYTDIHIGWQENINGKYKT